MWRAVIGAVGFVSFICGAIVELRSAQVSRASLPQPSPRTGVITRWTHRHPTAILGMSVLTGAAGTGYLWAVVFGDGLHGLLGSAQLDRATTYPDANAALLAALGTWIASSLLALAAGAGGLLTGRAASAWTGATIMLGAVVFAISRLVT